MMIKIIVARLSFIHRWIQEYWTSFRTTDFKEVIPLSSCLKFRPGEIKRHLFGCPSFICYLFERFRFHGIFLNREGVHSIRAMKIIKRHTLQNGYDIFRCWRICQNINIVFNGLGDKHSLISVISNQKDK